MEDLGLIIDCNGAACNCRCIHCCLDWKGKKDNIPYKRAQNIAEKFLRWRDKNKKTDWNIQWGYGYCAEFPELLEDIRFRQEHNEAGGDVLLANGIAFKSKDEINKWLTSVKEAGIRRIIITFFGLQETHDTWAGRKGDFEYIMNLAEIASELGIKRHETIYLHKDKLNEYETLLENLDKINGLEGRSISPDLDYRGRGKKLDHLRMENSDLEKLPDKVKNYINMKTIKPESDWYQTIMKNEIPAKQKRYLCLSVTEKNIDELELKTCEEIIGDLSKREITFYEKLPSLDKLAKKYGMSDNKKLYKLRDLEWKWQEQYYKDNPEMHSIVNIDQLQNISFRKSGLMPSW